MYCDPQIQSISIGTNKQPLCKSCDKWQNRYFRFYHKIKVVDLKKHNLTPAYFLLGPLSFDHGIQTQSSPNQMVKDLSVYITYITAVFTN